MYSRCDGNNWFVYPTHTEEEGDGKETFRDSVTTLASDELGRRGLRAISMSKYLEAF